MDEATLHISTKRTMVCSEKGEKVIVTPSTRAKTTTTLETTIPYGEVNAKVRPKAAQQTLFPKKKKRKAAGDSLMTVSEGKKRNDDTVTGHYFIWLIFFFIFMI